MKKTIIKENFAFSYFPKELFTREKISLSTLEYKDFAKFELKELGNYFTLKTYDVKEYSLQTIVLEIQNFILAQSFRGYTN